MRAIAIISLYCVRSDDGPICDSSLDGESVENDAISRANVVDK